MRIWIVYQYAVPPDRAGIARHYLLAREWIRRGHEVVVIASSFHHATRKEQAPGTRQVSHYEEIQGVPFVWISAPPYESSTVARVWNMAVFGARVMLQEGLRTLPRPDVVVGSTPQPFAALAAKYVARRLGVPFVFEVGDLWPQTLIDLGGYSPFHPFIFLLDRIERHLYRKSDFVVSMLPGAVEYMVAKGARRSRIAWIPNGVDLDMAPRVAPFPPRDVQVVTYAGAHGLANDLDSILDAAAMLISDGWGDRVRFRFIGDGPEKPRLQKRRRSESLYNVEFLDAVPKSMIYDELAKSDTLIVALRDVGLYRWGISLNKLYDYLAVGRPVIFAGNSVNNPVEEAAAGITVRPQRPLEIVQAIKRLADLPHEERVAMGQRGRAFVERHHNFRHLAGSFEQVILQVVAGPHPRTGLATSV